MRAHSSDRIDCRYAIDLPIVLMWVIILFSLGSNALTWLVGSCRLPFPAVWIASYPCVRIMFEAAVRWFPASHAPLVVSESLMRMLLRDLS